MREHRRTKQWIEVEKSAAATTTPRCACVLMGTRWGRAMPARSSSRAAHLLQRVRARLLAMGAQLRDHAISTTSMGDPSKRHPVCPLWVLPDLSTHDRDVRFTPMSRRRWLDRLRPKSAHFRTHATQQTPFHKRGRAILRGRRLLWKVSRLDLLNKRLISSDAACRFSVLFEKRIVAFKAPEFRS
jgi:hypothetical protein